jgi:hypothetical protein
LVEQRLGLGFGAAVDGGGKAFGHQVAGHAVTHDAGADPADAGSAGGDFL